MEMVDYLFIGAAILEFIFIITLLLSHMDD